jgi:hypothetical protein
MNARPVYVHYQTDRQKLHDSEPKYQEQGSFEIVLCVLVEAVYLWLVVNNICGKSAEKTVQ